MKRGKVLVVFWLGIGLAPASASSDDAWKAFASDVEDKCRLAISKVLKNPKIDVDAVGTESHGVAIGRGTVIGGKRRKAIVCLYDKKSRTVDVSGEMNP